MERNSRSVARPLVHLAALATLLGSGSAAAQETGEPTPPIVVLAGEPAPSPPGVATEAEASPSGATEPEPPASEAGAPVLSLGASGVLAATSIGGEIVVHAMSGADAALHLTPWLYAGARRAGFTLATPAAGDRFAIGASPMIGASFSLGEVVDLFGEVGAALQGIFGGQRDGAFGVAPFGGAGARFHLAEWMSLGVEATLHVPVTDSFLLHDAVLPRGAVWIAAGVGVLFHVR